MNSCASRDLFRSTRVSSRLGEHATNYAVDNDGEHLVAASGRIAAHIVVDLHYERSILHHAAEQLRYVGGLTV